MVSTFPRDVTVFLVAGAAKAGTTSIWNALRRHPECHMREVKELHYFDKLCFGHPDRRAALNRRIQETESRRSWRISERRRNRGIIRDCRDWLGAFDGRTRDDDAYLDYLLDGRTSQTVIGEATPAYATLPEPMMHEVAGLTPTLKIQFVMRDPIERLWSHICMAARGQARDGAGTKELALGLVRETLDEKAPAFARASDYRGIVTRIKAAFERSNRLLSFFETLFYPRGFAAISDFLGISAFRQTEERNVLNQGRKIEMPGDVRQSLACYLRPQYEFVDRMFGALVPASWSCPEERTL